MSQEPEKKPTSPAVAYLLILVGVIGIVTRFINDTSWTTIVILKFSISIIAIGYGLWVVFKKK